MSSHLTTGNYGEQLAVNWLEAAGYSILHRNWKKGRKEIDIIASKKGCLHFIEVKTSRTIDFGPPETRVTRKKIRSMQEVAEAYLDEYPQWRMVQYNIVAILLHPEMHQVVMLEDIS